MVTRPPASTALAFFFCAVAACGAVEKSPRAAVLQPAAQRASFHAVRPADALSVRTEAGSTRRFFSTATTIRTFTVMQPARAVVWSPHESAPKGGTR